MKKECIFGFLRNAVLVILSAGVISSCSDDPKEEPPIDHKDTDITLAGTAANDIPEEYRLLTENNGLYTYAGPLGNGELTLKTVQDGKSRFLYITEDYTGVSTSGEARQVVKGYYEFEIDLTKDVFSMRHKVEFGSGDVYLYGGEVFMPRTANADLMPVMEPTGDNPLLYEYYHYLGKGSFRFCFQDDPAKSTAYMATYGKAVFVNDEREKTSDMGQWNITEEGGYIITLDLLTREVNVTPANFFPDNVAELYVIGNSFGNTGADPAAVDAALTAPGSAGAVKMTRSGDDPDVFTVTGELEADKGGIRFLFQPRHSVPAFIKDSADTGKFFFTASAAEDEDTDPSSQWTVATSEKYDITVNIKTREVTLEPTEPKVNVIPDGYDLYISGTAAEGVPEQYRKFIVDAAGVYRYNLVLNTGLLSLVAKKDGQPDVTFDFDASNNTISGSGAPKIVSKGYHTLTVEPVDGGFSYTEGMGLGDYIYMHAAHINYPRYGLYSVNSLLPIAAREDNPFVYEIASMFYNLSAQEPGAATTYSFYLADVLNNNDIRLGKGSDGKIIIGHDGSADWPLERTSELKMSFDLITLEYKIEPVTLYPENVQQVWAIGNTFSDKIKGGDKAGEITNLEDDALNPSDMYGPSMIDRYTFGWNYWDRPRESERFPLTRDASNPNKFTITKDLDEDMGGFWFLLRRQGSLPAIVNDGSGKAIYYAGEADLPDDGHGAASYSSRNSKDIQASGHWQVPQGSGNYTVTLDIGTGQVSIQKN